MRKHSFLFISIFVIILASFGTVNARSERLVSKLPAPCIGKGPEVYLVINSIRRHIVDWDTFLSLGYQSSDIIPCAAAINFSEGQPITRLFKGSGAEIYLMQSGTRRHIPDIATFSSLGYQISDVTVLPDNVLALWPLGKPLATATTSTDGKVFRTFNVGSYTIQLWHPSPNIAARNDFATFKTPDGSTIIIPDVASIGQLPATDINGDGAPDVEVETRSLTNWGTTVYSFGKDARAILAIESSPVHWKEAGRGQFVDLNKDGIYEFITTDPLPELECWQPAVTTILQYDTGQGRYVGASPRFAWYYAEYISKLSTTLKPGTVCEIYPLIVTQLYLNKTSEAKAAFDRLYNSDFETLAWNMLVTAVQHGRFYVAQ